jgi:hypothetical protein
VQEVKKHTAKIKEEAQQCLAERQARMNRTIDDTHRTADDTHRTVNRMEKLVQSIYYLLLDRLAIENRGYGQNLILYEDQRNRLAIETATRRTIMGSAQSESCQETLS